MLGFHIGTYVRGNPCCGGPCAGVPGRRGGGEGASPQGHLVDVVVAWVLQVSQGEVGAGRRGNRSWGAGGGGGAGEIERERERERERLQREIQVVFVCV